MGPPSAALAPPPLLAAPPGSIAPPGSPAAPPPAEPEPKKPSIDPKLAIALPLGGFGAFVALTLLVVIYAAAIRPRLGPARGAESSVTPP